VTGHVWAWLQRRAAEPPCPVACDELRSLPANYVDSLLAGLCRAILADGILDARHLTHLLLNHACEAHNPTHHPRECRRTREAVLQAALRLHSIGDDPDEPDA
jgi:hypothetical protein